MEPARPQGKCVHDEQPVTLVWDEIPLPPMDRFLIIMQQANNEESIRVAEGVLIGEEE